MRDGIRERSPYFGITDQQNVVANVGSMIGSRSHTLVSQKVHEDKYDLAFEFSEFGGFNAVYPD